jgi:uncharacterized protein
MAGDLTLTEKDGTLRFEVHAKPRAKKSRIVGVREGASGGSNALEIALAAPPVDGAANAELIRLLALVFGVPKRNVEILRGETSHTKLVAITGLDEETLRARLSSG